MKAEKKTKCSLQLLRSGALARQAGRDGSPDNLPCEETTRQKPQDLTTHKQEVSRQSRPALKGARCRGGGGGGEEGGEGGEGEHVWLQRMETEPLAVQNGTKENWRQQSQMWGPFTTLLGMAAKGSRF